MNVTKRDILHLIDDLSETELRILYTFIEEFRIAEAERSSAPQERKNITVLD
ncbi:hypothetical protein HXA34_05765 [Salipaludibacillus agaradhaerens]|jgi:hypothetical protein|uniref:Uncharacterized protein n=1 Tax=Salipaludibacillus agaradhaerens TaxID=76935 RepID=A0A9Q4B301_SALAG|nr:hypothetical protein [Salipaludibacillus agaradhaerens]UJW56996.1 hypothetical protein HXZ66_05965 [Bacillus sp. A116_S68]MCR6097386.1 hypothetical protein [Salipaludibacillus agaradhaerens]MCR6105796.1 hypothetical protein [Salipaludibacillus agaradhaerens]MCR6113129.1 hypothetical protein [Salipaludibacillus agaradhaerens]MCR6117832.1 hypothetical protein [Salipaludibacillus agaradhaerens]